MDLGEDYGDIRHKHGHIHSKPRKHQDTIDTALKDWCLEIFEEDGEEKCRDLNQNFFDTIITGSANDVNLSKIYEKVNEMSKINHKKNQQNSNDNNFEISIDGTQLVLKINDKIFKKEIIVNENKELIAIFSLKKDLLSKVTDVEKLIPQSSNEEESDVSGDFRETLRSSSIDKGILENQLNEINNIDNNGTTSGGTTTEAERTTEAESNSQITNQSNITIKIKLEKDKFMINKQEFVYSNPSEINNSITELEIELKKINLKTILDNNNGKMDTIRMKKEEIDRIKLLKSDNLTPKRRLQYLEKWDQDIFKELVGLIGYLIIGICFGIYCIYNFFVLQLK